MQDPLRLSDDDLRRILDEIHVVPMAMSLVQMTGDEHILSEIEPYIKGPGDHLESIPAHTKAQLRDRLIVALRAFHRRAEPRAAEPTPDRMLRMLRVAAGAEVAPEYLPMIRDQIGIGVQRNAAKGIAGRDAIKNFRVVIVGAGVSGICAAIKLKEAGITCTILEKNDDVGGTWLENRYPGCAVDTPNHFWYQFSFRPNHDWPAYYAPRDANLAYLRRCVEEYGIGPHISFNSEVTAARYDAETQSWTIEYRSLTGEMEVVSANALICAVGQLNRPAIPDFPGLKEFRGPVVHSAEWPDDLDLAGRNVALVGSAASAVQIGCAIAPDVKQLSILQRTPTWLTKRPNVNSAVTDEVKWALKHVPFYAQWHRFRVFWSTADVYYPALKIDPAWKDGKRSVNALSDRLRRIMTRYIAEELAGREDLLAKAIPDDPPFARRVLGDPGWYRMLRRDNVRLETAAIEAVEKHGIRLKDGSSVPAEIIVLATGFQGVRMLWPMQITGRSRRTIRELWGDDDPRAYLGITVPDFPNMFLLYGPNSGVLHGGSAMFLAECQVRYVVGCIEEMIKGSYRSMAIKPDIFQRYNDEMDEKLKTLVWSDPDVRSWHKNEKGRVVANSPWRLIEYWRLTERPDLREYELER